MAAESAIKAKGIDAVFVYCVNDAAVMKAWAKDQKVTGIMSFWADPGCVLTKAVGMEITHPGPQGIFCNTRCKRFVLLVEDGTVKYVAVSEASDDPAGDNDPSGPVTAKTLVDGVLAAI